MPGSATSTFTDAEEYRAELSETFGGLVVAAPGAFAARVAQVTLHHFQLLRARETLSRAAFVALLPERVFISFSCCTTSSLIWRGLTLAPGEIVLHAIGERLHQRTVGPCCWGFIALSPAWLAAACKTATGSKRALPEFGRILRPTSRDRRYLIHLHCQAARLAETRPHILGHPQVIHSMEQELEGALMACLTNSEARPESDAVRHANEILIRFEDAFAEHSHRRLRLAELCRGLGVADRTFHSWCQTFLGVSPQRYMRLRRLHLVHAALLRAGGKGASVAEITREAGFAAPGRFAALYRSAFGEAPSATLRRPSERWEKSRRGSICIATGPTAEG